jgi:hypothetical protein
VDRCRHRAHRQTWLHTGSHVSTRPGPPFVRLTAALSALSWLSQLLPPARARDTAATFVLSGSSTRALTCEYCMRDAAMPGRPHCAASEGREPKSNKIGAKFATRCLRRAQSDGPTSLRARAEPMHTWSGSVRPTHRAMPSVGVARSGPVWRVLSGDNSRSCRKLPVPVTLRRGRIAFTYAAAWGAVGLRRVHEGDRGCTGRVSCRSSSAIRCKRSSSCRLQKAFLRRVPACQGAPQLR